MMTFETFKMILDQQREVDSFLQKFYDMGIDLIDCPVFDVTTPLTKEIFKLSYGDDWEYVYDWFTWYLWELPNLKKNGKIKDAVCKEDGFAWDKDGKVIDVDSDESFFAYIDKEYNRRE